MQKVSNQGKADTICLKGYLKTFYLRAINRRSELDRACAWFNITHIIFCLFITPIYFGFISYFMGFIVHKNKEKKVVYLNIFKVLFFLLFSLLRGLLMFPYIILFFPFMVILILPGVFSYKYYLYIFIMHYTHIRPGYRPLTNVGNN